MYKITRKFVGGVLDGLYYTNYQAWPLPVGGEYDGYGGQKYIIIECELETT